MSAHKASLGSDLEKLEKSLQENSREFGIELSAADISLLSLHYQLIIEANALLHLTAPSPPEEFAVRHFLESLFLLRFLPQDALIVDVGPGGGFPSMPCLIKQKSHRGILIESKPKKAAFLQNAIEKLALSDRVCVIAKQFSEAEPPLGGSFITTRALDRFTQHLGRLLTWGKSSHFLLYGGENLQTELERKKLAFEKFLIPLSERRFIFRFVRN